MKYTFFNALAALENGNDYPCSKKQSPMAVVAFH
jgi:hypothetical protein